MIYNIDLEKLTDKQLEAFKVIDEEAYKKEMENRSTYSDQEMRHHQVFTDLHKAYFYLKPLYDNMRNTDVKKTITQSGILTTMEKVFRYAKLKNVEYDKFEGEPVDNSVDNSKEVSKQEVPETEKPVDAPVPEPVEVKAAEVKAEPEKQEEVLSPIETVSQEELNKILASIPTVEQI